MSEDIYVKALVRIPRQRVRDMIVTAVEGGCNYWAKFKFPDNWKEKYKLYEDIPFKSGHVEVFDIETGELLGYLNGATIKTGLQHMADRKDWKGNDIPLRHFKNVMSNNMDAETADVFVQLCTMGQITYG